MLPHEGWKHRAASQPHRRPAVAASPRALGKKGNARTARLGQPHAEAGCGPLLPAAPARRPRAARSRRRGAARSRPCGGGGSALAAGRGRAVGAALLTKRPQVGGDAPSGPGGRLGPRPRAARPSVTNGRRRPAPTHHGRCPPPPPRATSSRPAPLSCDAPGGRATPTPAARDRPSPQRPVAGGVVAARARRRGGAELHR